MSRCFLASLIIALGSITHGESNAVTFPVQKIFFKTESVELRVQMAVTPQQRAHGLMFRTELPDTEGMLFVSEEESYQSFWMKDTRIALSIGFFDKKKRLMEVLDMYPPLGPVMDSQLPSYRSQKKALYALEVPLGWFQRKKIKINSSFDFKK